MAMQAPQPVGAIGSQNLAIQGAIGPSTLYLVQEGPGYPSNDILLKFESGTLSTVGNIGFGDIRGLAYDATTDTLYGVSRYSWRLLTIDRTTGVGTPVSDNPYLPLDSNTSEISVDSTGTMFGLGHSDSQCCVDTLLNVDKGTGIASSLGVFDVSVSGLAIDHASGMLYGTTYDGQLYTIDSSGSFATLVGQITGSNGGVARIAFDHTNGMLYGITFNNQLVTIDLSTLVATEVAQFSTSDQIYSLDFVSSVAQDTTVTIDWTTYPDGSPIPNETDITNQFQSLGLVFLSPPGPPRVLNSLGGILISGGPTGFFGEIHMSFLDVGSGLPTSLTVEIIGSGLNISASLEAFDNNGNSLGIVTHTYTGNSGQLSPFTFSTPAGKRIASAIYKGGLNPNAAASIGTLIIHTDDTGPNEASIDIKPGSQSNPINRKSSGKTPVAILSLPDFDAPSEIDKASLTFGSTGDEASLAFCNKGAEDVNNDGLLDQVCHFYTKKTGFQKGDVEGILKGQTVDGIPIEGSDLVTILH